MKQNCHVFFIFVLLFKLWIHLLRPDFIPQRITSICQIPRFPSLLCVISPIPHSFKRCAQTPWVTAELQR